ncbi:ArsR/SmtB family transcription factor [Streptomyces jumonjinensis]|uniref:ArsR/SmtB family transcription factor n=1 Tax=Streptomyces jumonjinensis TaxID=1945 RepID=UPI00378A6385
MLRIHFTLQDLARVRVAMLGPLAETQLGLNALQRRDGTALFGGWRECSGPRVGPDARDLARFLAPPGTGLVDLFTLAGQASSIDEGLDALLHAAPERLRAEFDILPGVTRRRTPWLTAVTNRDRASLERFLQAFRACHRVTVAPYWERIQQHLSAESDLCGKLMIEGGVGDVLSSLRPAAVWEPPVLEVPDYRAWLTDRDLHLSGRGLVLAPSVFCGPTPHLFEPTDGEGEVLLIYPTLKDPVTASRIWSTTHSGHRHLVALLGRTRAAVLMCLSNGHTTIELARALGISPSGASEHATVLRNAGFITSRRHRNTVHHTLTKLGRSVLQGTTQP